MENKTKILVIDDEADICSLLKSMLERTGKYDVIFSTHPQEGIGLAGSFKPDLILLDVIMPEMDGAEVARRLSENETTQEIPVVFVTAVAIPMAFLTALVESDELQQRAGKIGGHYFIQKPITGNELITRIESILSETKPG